MSNPITTPGQRTQYTAIIGGILNVVAILIQTFFGIDIPSDAWMAANTVLGSLLALFLGEKGNRTLEAANQAVASAAQPTIVVNPTSLSAPATRQEPVA